MSQTLSNRAYLFVLAGGKGTRLASLTMGRIPKSLVEIGDSTILQRMLQLADQSGVFDRVVLSLSNQNKDWNKKIEEAVRKSSFSFEIIVSELEPSGTLNAFCSTFPKDGSDWPNVTVAYGDTVFSNDTFQALREHLALSNGASGIGASMHPEASSDKSVDYRAEGSSYLATNISSSLVEDSDQARFSGLIHLDSASVRELCIGARGKSVGLSSAIAEEIIAKKPVRLFLVRWSVNINFPEDVDRAQELLRGTE